ncbi:MAG: carboxymethylenebutenolidase [Actinomycetota bacterium]|nr:carboxymethylenebutenolidase [Actinomycetota bacterium]
MCHPEVPAGQAIPEVAREEVSVSVPGGGEMPCLLALPENGSAAGVLVVADVYGRSPFYENLASRLATAGFAAILPDYFFREGALSEVSVEAAMERRSRFSERRALSDLHAAIDWLRSRSETTAGALTGTVGCCMGGTLVLGLAATRKDLASVCYYGFPAGSRAGDDNLPPPLKMLDEMSGPLLGFWGDQDEGVGMHNVEALIGGLEKRGVTVEHTIYPGLGHGFLARSNLEEGTDGYAEACDSWTRAIGFYREHLKR